MTAKEKQQLAAGAALLLLLWWLRPAETVTAAWRPVPPFDPE